MFNPDTMRQSTEIAALLLFFIGFYGVIARRNIIKSILSIGIMETAVILFFLNVGAGKTAPIGTNLVNAADPVPQALMITTIVVGIGLTAVSMAMFLNLYHKYGSTNWKKVLKARKMK